MIEYRNMEAGDIAAGLRLCREAGWNQVERDWKIFLKSGPDASRVAVSEAGIVGTVTTITYQHLFSWIGMVLVDKSRQRQGIGMKLLEEALHILKEEETVKLDATPAGRAVYLKMGFVDEYPLSRMRMIVDGNKLNISTARPVLKNDLQRLAAFDHAVFGANRRQLLEWMSEGAPQYAFLVEDRSKVMGYCLGRKGYNFIHIGPVVAGDINIAKNLVLAALHSCTGQTVILDALHFQPEWMAWLESIGFTEQRPLTRMYRGTNRFPGTPKKQFAILGPEFG